MRKTRYVVALGSVLLAGTAFGQVTPPATGPAPVPAAPAPAPPVPTPAKSTPYGPGMKVNISADGSKYIRFLAWTQVWAQYNENNSNTTVANTASAANAATGTPAYPGKGQSDQVDFGIRRTRLIILAQLNPRFLIYTHLGINSQNAESGGLTGQTVDPSKRPQLYVHEAVAEYRVNKYLNVGGGLHYNNGISRMTSASTANILALDVPVVNWPTIDALDQNSFWLGFYAKGRIGGFDYRVSANDALLTNEASTPISGTATSFGNNIAQYNPRNNHHVYQGYFDYEFLEKEANLLPYQTGSYLGTKRVFNVGAGFLYNKDGMYSRPAAYPVFTAANPAPAGFDPFSTTTNHDIRILAADVFYDAPLDTASRTALTFYGVYYHDDFGPNYVRNVGVLNPGSGVTTPGVGAGASLRGNAVPLIGTGSSIYAQAGLLLPKNLLGPKAKLQPYVAYLRNSFEGLRNPDGGRERVNVYDAGVNLLLDGQNAKITLNYRARPDFSNQTFLPANNGAATVNSVRYRPEITLQTQVFL